jgi:hypothetical protein
MASFVPTSHPVNTQKQILITPQKPGGAVGRTVPVPTTVHPKKFGNNLFPNFNGNRK